MRNCERKALLQEGMPSRRRLLTGGVGLALAAFGSDSVAAAPPPFIADGGGQFIELDPREDVSSMVLTDFAGRKHPLSKYRGRPALLAFWASWCPPCARELPILHRLQRQPGLGFAVVPISLDRDEATAKQFIDRLALKGFQSYIDSAGVVASGPRSETQTAFQLYGMPMSYILDIDGRTAGYVVGAADWSAPAALRLMTHYSQ